MTPIVYGSIVYGMVTNRKPLFVSEEALKRLHVLAQEKKCFLGDVVDMLLGVKSESEVNANFREKNKQHLAKKVGRIS